MKNLKKLRKASELIGDHQYRDAQAILETINRDNLSIIEQRDFAILKLMAMLYYSTRWELYKYSQKLSLEYDLDVIQFYALIFRLEYLIKDQSRKRVEIIFSKMEEKIVAFDNNDYYHIFLLEKSDYYFENGYLLKSIEILNKFTADDIPCPLMYHEIRTKLMIRLDNKREVYKTLEEVDILVDGLELGNDKKETLYAIRLRSYIYLNDLEGIVLYSNLLLDILKMMQIPFSGNHIVMVKGLHISGIPYKKIQAIVETFDIIEKSRKYLEEIEKLQFENGEFRMDRTMENVAEMIFQF